MIKEICAQCLQPHRDPVTGEVSYVFSCFNQDQALDQVDFGGLNARLQQNSLQEKLTVEWIATCINELKKERTNLVDEIKHVDAALSVLRRLNGANGARPKRTLSVAARRKIAAAQRARWAKVRAAKKAA